MDGWILQGANTRFRAADVPRIVEREWLSHSDEGAGSCRGYVAVPCNRPSGDRRDGTAWYGVHACWRERSHRTPSYEWLADMGRGTSDWAMVATRLTRFSLQGACLGGDPAREMAIWEIADLRVACRGAEAVGHRGGLLPAAE